MTVKQLAARIKHAAAVNNLPSKSMSYLRRGFSKLAGALVGRTDAIMLMGHLQKTATFGRVYSTGPAQFDMARVIFWEAEPDGGATVKVRLAQLRERSWMGFAMTSLCLETVAVAAAEESGEQRVMVAAAEAPLQAIPGATRKASGRRTTSGTTDTTEKYLHYDYVAQASEAMKAALKRVNCLGSFIVKQLREKYKDKLRKSMGCPASLGARWPARRGPRCPQRRLQQQRRT